MTAVWAGWSGDDERRADRKQDDWKRQALADFSRWLEELAADPPAAADGEPTTCDLHDLFAELAALRQEVRLQNREQSRAGRELTKAAAGYEAVVRMTRRRDEELAAFERRVARTAEDRCLLPVLDLRDALERGWEAARRVGARRRPFRRLPPEFGGVVEGYELAVRRCDRLLTRFGVQRVSTVGAPFDSRTMHAIETRRLEAGADGAVVEEFVSGFVRHDAVLRLAEVAVNRLTASRLNGAEEERNDGSG